jgi:hypothetical protein
MALAFALAPRKCKPSGHTSHPLQHATRLAGGNQNEWICRDIVVQLPRRSDGVECREVHQFWRSNVPKRHVDPVCRRAPKRPTSR